MFVQLGLECVAVLVTLAAAVGDLQTRRIPNVFPAALVILGIATQAYAGGLPGAALAVALVISVILIGSFAHAQHWLGGGDVKLIAGCVACLGPQFTPWFLFFTALAGGILAVTMAIRERRIVAVLGNVTFGMLHAGGQIAASATAARLPYAVAISSGMLLTVAVRFLPSMRVPL